MKQTEVQKVASAVSVINKDQHQELMEEIRKINVKLDPIYESYNAAQKLGGWAKWSLGFLLLITSLYLAFKQIFNH